MGLKTVLGLYGICLVTRRTQVHVTLVLQSSRSKPRFPISRVIVVKETRAVDFFSICNRRYRLDKVFLFFIFCQKRTYLKSKDLINVCTFEPSENIRKAAEAQGDESMLHVLRNISHDFIASESKCHNSCYSLYILKKDPKAEECNSLREVSFQELVAEITRGIREGKAYDIITLLTMNQSDLESKGVDASSYRKQHLKARL